MAGVNELISSDDRFTQDIVDAQFLHLFREEADFEAGPPTLSPELATSYVWEDASGNSENEGPTLLVQLDPRASWSDGEPVTADDVRWTWLAQTSEAVAWPYAESKESIREVEVVGPHEVRYHLTHRYLTALQDINLGVVLPKHRWSELPFEEWRVNPEWFLDRLTVAGPFQLANWERDSEVVLERNPAYSLGEAARLDRVVFRIIPKKSNQVAGLLSGELHFIERIPAADAQRIVESPEAQLVEYWTRQYDFLCWNSENPLFEDSAVRRALTLAIDRQALVDTLWYGYARVSKTPVIASVWAHHKALEDYPYDPKRSQELLAEAGWSDTDGDGTLDRNGQPFRFEILTNSDSRQRLDAATMIQEQLSQVGIDAQIRSLEFLTASALTLAHDFDATISGWLIDTSLDLSFAFHTDWIEPGYNLGSYSNPELDLLLDESGRQVDPEGLHRTLLEIQEIIFEEQPYTQLWEPKGLNAASHAVRGIQSNSQSSYFRLDQWWIDGASR